MQDLDQIPVNVALVLKVDNLEGAKDLLTRIETLLDGIPGVRVVYRNLSVDRLWIRRGGDGPV